MEIRFGETSEMMSEEEVTGLLELPPLTPSGDSSYNSDFTAGTPQSDTTSRNRNSSSLSSSAFRYLK